MPRKSIQLRRISTKGDETRRFRRGARAATTSCTVKNLFGDFSILRPLIYVLPRACYQSAPSTHLDFHSVVNHRSIGGELSPFSPGISPFLRATLSSAFPTCLYPRARVIAPRTAPRDIYDREEDTLHERNTLSVSFVGLRSSHRKK